MPPAIISERLARDLFPHDEEPIGARIKIQGDARIVIGVLSRESDRSASAWVLPDAGTDLATLSVNTIRLRDAESTQFGPAAVGVADRIAALVGETATRQRAPRVRFRGRKLRRSRALSLRRVPGRADLLGIRGPSHRLRQPGKPPTRTRHRAESRAGYPRCARGVPSRHRVAPAARKRFSRGRRASRSEFC